MDVENLSFEKDLWGQCNKLHERLIKKKDYYKHLLKAFKPIQNSIDELNEKMKHLNFSMDPTIPPELYTSSKTIHSQTVDMNSICYGLPLTIQKIKEFILISIDYNNETLSNVLTNLEKLIAKMKEEKNEYDGFQKSLKVLSDSKKVMDKNMKVYHQKMFSAEQSVLDLKKTETSNVSVNDDALIMDDNDIKDIKDQKPVQLTSDALKSFEIYQESVDKANALREDSINKQKHLLNTYKNIEEEVGKINTNILNIFFEKLKYQKEFIEKRKNEIENIKNNINTRKDIKQLILNLASNEKPEEKYLFINFPTTIDLNKSESNEEFRIYTQSIHFIQDIVKGEYPKYNEKLEKEKNNMREELYTLFREYSKDGEEKLLEFIKNKDIHNYFLVLLSKLRTNNRFKQKPPLIDLLGIIINKILDVAEQEKNYDKVRNCIILSQTFFYEKDNQKCYLIEKIKTRKWFKSVDFWFHFIDQMIVKELDRFLLVHPEITKGQILSGSDDMSDNMKFKLSELLFAQLLPYVNNMNEFNVELKNIIKVTEAFYEKYKYLDDEHKESIIGLICDNKDELERLRKECEKEKGLLATCNNNINKKAKNISKDENINNSKNILEKNIDNNVNKNININNNININIYNKTNESKNNSKDNNSIVNKNTNSNKNANINKNNIDVNSYHTTAEYNNISKNKTTPNEATDKKNNNEETLFGKIINPLKNLNFNIISKKEEKKEEKKEVKKEEKKEVKKEEKKEIKKEEKKEVKKVIKQEPKIIKKKEEPPIEKREIKMNKSNISQNNNSNINNKNPFGVALKKVPSKK